MSRVYTYRTAARRVHRSIRQLQVWRSKYLMKVTEDPATREVLIDEAELLKHYRLALGRDPHIKHQRRAAYATDTLPLDWDRHL